jgi:hypothetical protein
MIPYTDYECRLALDELYRGDKVVIPSSLEHAEFMVRIAQFYIDQHHREMLDTLAKDYSK